MGIVNEGTVHLSKFSEIPVLTKDMLRENYQDLISSDYKTRKPYYNSTGGSTGEPTRFIQDNLYAKWGKAASYYWYKDIIGIDEPRAKKVILWGSDRDLFQGGIGWKAKIANWMNNTILLNSFRMTEADMGHYIGIINNYKPDLIRGYAGSLYELCKYAERNNMNICTPKAVISSAETLRDEMRCKIETVFGTKVYNHYGSREANNLAGECKEGMMHVLAFHNYIEVLDNRNQPVAEGKEGRVIATNLHNYSMPLIRYEIGDTIVVGSQQCNCRNILPMCKKISGRIMDHFIRQDGTVIPAEFFIHLIGVVSNARFIKKFQVIQEDYQRIKILVVPQGDIEDYTKRDIENKIRQVMGHDCMIIWEFVDKIYATKSGKYLYTKSLVRR